MRLTRVALDPRMHGVTPAGLKVAGFAAALARVPSALGLNDEGPEAIASAIAGSPWKATNGERGSGALQHDEFVAGAAGCHVGE